MTARSPRKRIYELVGEDQVNEDDGSYRQKLLQVCKTGMKVRTEREADNAFDTNAVSIRLEANGKRIGYVKRDDALKLAAFLDEGGKVEARIHQLTGGLRDYPSFGCVVAIVPQGGNFPEPRPLRAEQEYYEHAPTWQKSRSTKDMSEDRKPTGLLIKLLKAIFK